MGACEASGGPRYLARRQEDRAAGRGDDTVIAVIIITHQHHRVMKPIYCEI